MPLSLFNKEQVTVLSPIYPPLKPFIYKAFDPLQECSFNARRVPLNAPQFSKNWQLRPPFFAYFYLLKILKPL